MKEQRLNLKYEVENNQNEEDKSIAHIRVQTPPCMHQDNDFDKLAKEVHFLSQGMIKHIKRLKPYRYMRRRVILIVT